MWPCDLRESGCQHRGFDAGPFAAQCAMYCVLAEQAVPQGTQDITNSI
jgi:hypothetical protein